MIAKGTTHNNGAKLADYMTVSKEGERAELWQLRGFEATNIKDAFRDVQIMAGATKCEQPFFHVQVRNREGEKLTRQQWERAADRIERMLGLSGQPRAITFHTYQHNDDEHMHVAWSRIDEETLKAKPLPFFKVRLKKISRELEIEFRLVPVQNEREGNIKYAPTRAQEEQARRVGVDIHEVRNAIRDCYDRSDCGTSFQAALENEGLTLAKGDTRGFVVIDPGGGLHVLSKRILDVSATEIRDRMSDLVIGQLPTVEAVRALHNEEVGKQIEQYFPTAPADELINQYFGDTISRLVAKRKEEESIPGWDRDQADIDWQDSITNAAIEMEKVERRFVEPKSSESRGVGSRERKEERERQRRDEWLKSLPALDSESIGGLIKEAISSSDSARSFATALNEKGLYLAVVTPDESRWIHKGNPYLREPGRFPPKSLEAMEFVVLNEKGHIHQLNIRNTDKDRAQLEAFMGTLDRKDFQGIETTRNTIQIRADEQEILRQAFRDASAVGLLDAKNQSTDWLRIRPSHSMSGMARTAPSDSLEASSLRTVAKVLDVASSIFESLMSPVLTPEQKRDAAIATQERRAEAGQTIDYSQFLSERAQDHREHEQLQTAEKEREREGRDR